jgi:hypothetical protein
MRSAVTRAVTLVAGLAIGAAGMSATSGARGDPASHQQSRLLARRVLPAATFAPNSPPAGAFFTVQNTADASANHVADELPGDPAYFAHQPVQGLSSFAPASDGTWWALTDNGFGARDNSADAQLQINRIDPGFRVANGTPTVLQRIVLSDPFDKVPWQTVCDRNGQPLPDLLFNVLPPPGQAVCGPDASRRILTGFDFDPESLVVGKDGSFWIGEEFGPFVLHFDGEGRLLHEPFALEGVKSPQNPTLDIAHEAPNLAASRGFESLAISPDRMTLYPMLEGAVTEDDPQDVRIYTFDIRKERFESHFVRLRLEMPGAKVNNLALLKTDHSSAYPTAVPPTGTGGQSVAELSAINDHQYLAVERDGNGDGTAAPRFKKVFLVDTKKADDGYVSKRLLVDLMAIPDPGKVGGDGDFFRFPFNTIESVHAVDATTIIVANDNNYPFSNGRARSKSVDRSGPLAPDDNEMILIGLGTPLKVDHRLVPPLGA